MKNTILKNLNEEQKKAVTYGNGPVLIIAGPGTGKTTVITQRITWLILEGKVKPEEILAMTFTDKAAEEMEERLDKILPYSYLDLSILTFHSFCEKVLRDWSLDIGLSPNFKLLNSSQQAFLICQNLSRFNLDYYKPLGNPYKFIRSLVSHFSRAKDEMVSPEEYLEYALNLKLDEDSSQGAEILKTEKARLKEIAEAYDTYQKLLFETEALDFGDLILFTIKLFKKRPQILKKYQDRFKYVLVDEFQDTNWAQYELLKLLTSGDLNLMVVADPKQAIYRWRGASYSNIYQIKKDFPETEIIFLKKNYRSGQAILNLVHQFISQNYDETVGLDEELKRIFAEDLIAVRESNSEIEFFQADTLEFETRRVAEKILELKEKNPELSFNDFAILVRTNAQAEPFCQMLARAEIPFQFLAKSGLFNKPIVLDIIAYLKLLDSYHESNAFYRILNSPLLSEKLKNEELANLVYLAKKRGFPLYEAAKNASLVPGLSREGIKNLMSLISLIEKHTELAKTKPVSFIVYSFLKESGYFDILKRRGESDLKGVEEISWLNQFLKKINDFETTSKDKSVHSFLQLIDIIFEVGENESLGLDEQLGPEAVKVLTVHGAKGLEFAYVFMVDLVEHKFPSINRAEPISLPDSLIKEIIPKGDVHLQEERRLFYVAMTRSRDGLFFLAAQDYGGKRKKKVSPFLYELGLVRTPSKTKNILGSLEILEPPVKNKFSVQGKYNLPAWFSYSQFEAYRKCPLQYKLGFILRLPREGNPSLSFGRTIHDTFFQYLKENLEKNKIGQNSLFKKTSGQKEDVSLKRLEEIYKKCWLDEWYKDAEQKEEFRKLGKEMLKNFYDDCVKTKPRVKELEFPFNFKLGDYLIKGKIDRIDETLDGLEFLDYKTGRPKKEAIEDKRQLIIYQMAGETLFREKIACLSYYYPGTGEKQSFLASKEDLERVKEDFLKVIEEIKKENFAPRPSEMCKYCDFKDICEYRLT